MKKAPFYICKAHDNAAKEMKIYAKKALKKLEEENITEEDDSGIDDKHLIKPGTNSTL